MLTKEYQDHLTKQLDAMQGEVSMYYKNMITGETFAYHEKDALMPASVIKLPIFLHYLELAAEGKADPKEKILCTDGDIVGGSGALQAFHGDHYVSLETLWELMITLSDNTATNILINHAGRETFVQAFPKMGLTATKLNRILFDAEASARGIENSTSAYEMGMLLEQVYRRTFVDKKTSEYAEYILARQQFDTKIPGLICDENVRIAHKTGSDDGITNDVGLVYAKQPFVVCFLSNHTDVMAFDSFIRQASYDLFVDCGGPAYL